MKKMRNIKKEAILVIILVSMICLILSSCTNTENNSINDAGSLDISEMYQSNDNYNFSSEKISLDENEVLKFEISMFPAFIQPFEVVDRKQIEEMTDYFTSLTLIETNRNPRDYFGSAYEITISLIDNSTRTFGFTGNMFFTEGEDFIYEILYEQGIAFSKMIAEILESKHIEAGEPSFTGKIVSVNSEKSGHNISIVLKDKNNKKHQIYVKDASIMESSGNGRLILFEEDEVRVFYEKDKYINDNVLIATIAFIKEAP
ncbi:MAG: hypothetical protein JXQ23_11350 [Clostridia bacterium]|nr:hypothetical protein [Clostridia bacterium]